MHKLISDESVTYTRILHPGADTDATCEALAQWFMYIRDGSHGHSPWYFCHRWSMATSPGINKALVFSDGIVTHELLYICQKPPVKACIQNHITSTGFIQISADGGKDLYICPWFVAGVSFGTYQWFVELARQESDPVMRRVQQLPVSPSFYENFNSGMAEFASHNGMQLIQIDKTKRD